MPRQGTQMPKVKEHRAGEARLLARFGGRCLVSDEYRRSVREPKRSVKTG